MDPVTHRRHSSFAERPADQEPLGTVHDRIAGRLAGRPRELREREAEHAATFEIAL